MKRTFYLIFLLNLLLAVSLLGKDVKLKNPKGGGKDDLPQIRAALAKIENAGGGKLIFKSGKTYSVKPTGSDNVGIDINYDNITFTTTGKKKATIKIVEETKNAGYCWGIRIKGAKDVTINNLHLIDKRKRPKKLENRGKLSGGAYLIQVEGNCNGLKLNDLILEDAIVDNLTIRGSGQNDYTSKFIMTNCVLKNGYRNNMSVIRGKNLKIKNCQFLGAGGYGDPEAGIDFEPNGFVTKWDADGNPTEYGASYGYSNITIEKCTFKNNGKFGVVLTKHKAESKIQNEGHVTIKNCYFEGTDPNNKKGWEEGSGIVIHSSNNTITGNVFTGMRHDLSVVNIDGSVKKEGIIVLGVSKWTKTTKDTIENNYFCRNPFDNAERHLIGIYASATKNNVIKKNYSYENNKKGFVFDDTGNNKNTVSSNTTKNKDNDFKAVLALGGNTTTKKKIVGQWDFNDSNDLTKATKGSKLTINGSVKYAKGTITLKNGQYLEAKTSSAKGSTYTLLMDIRIKKFSGSKYASLMQTDVANNSDGDLFVHSSGKIGSSSMGSRDYSNEGKFSVNKWYRVVLVVKNKDAYIYLNGTEVLTSKRDGNRLNLDSKVLFFCDDGNEEQSTEVSKIVLYNYALSSSKIKKMGSVNGGNGGGNEGTINVRIASKNDDAEERYGSSSVKTRSQKLYLAKSNKSTITGLRFQNIQIPQGAIIDDAFLEFTAKRTTKSNTNCTIKGESIDNSKSFNSKKKISKRKTTSTSKSWKVTDKWKSESVYKSPNIKEIIQQIVNRTGWDSGNSLSLIITSTGKERRVYSYDGSKSKAPKLQITYSTNGGANKVVAETETTVNLKWELTQNYPNPFNPSTNISFTVPQASNVKIVVYDMLGREVAKVVDNFYESGSYNQSWMAKDKNGTQLASGIYIARIQAGSFTKSIKMMLLR